MDKQTLLRQAGWAQSLPGRVTGRISTAPLSRGTSKYKL